MLQPQLLERPRGKSRRGREVHVGEAALERGVGVDHARRDEGTPIALDQPLEPIEPPMLARQLDRRLRRGHVHHDHGVELLLAPEPIKVVAQALDGGRERLAPPNEGPEPARAVCGTAPVGEAGSHARLDRFEVVLEPHHEGFRDRGVVAGQRACVPDEPARRDVPPAEGEVAQPGERQPRELG